MEPSVTFFFATGLIVWGAAYLLGLRNKVTKPDGVRRIPVWTKLVMMAVVIGMAMGGLLREVTPFGMLIVLGLLGGTIGDLILADLFPLEKPEIPGMFAFAIGHGFYIAAPLTLGSWPPLVAASAVMVGAAGGLFVWRLSVFNPGGSRRLNVGSLLYGLILMMTLTLSVSAIVLFPSRLTLAFGTGVAFFTASDMLLAQYRIRESGPPKLRDLVWGLYSTGQLLIVVSISL